VKKSHLASSVLASAGALAFRYLPYLYIISSVPYRRPPDEETLAEVRQQADREHPSPRVNPTEQELIEQYAREDSDDPPDGLGEDWHPGRRVLLARLEVGERITETNDYLQRIEPDTFYGSGKVSEKGGWDFHMVVFVEILHRFGDDPDRLYPETREHILETLLPLSGGEPETKVPNTFGRIFDTENHVLMIESTRFLKNQWLYHNVEADPTYNNQRNGLEEWLVGYLNHIRVNGFYEFNSVPYQGYALHPLLNLEAFAKGPVRDFARAILDDLSWRYALGSCNLRQVAPFRRQFSRAGRSDLELSRMTPLVRLWTAPPDGPPREVPTYGDQHASVVAPLAYRPPEETREWIERARDTYFARIGHGLSGSPELHSGGPGYLLSAGGAYRGERNKVVPRPTTLILDDGSEEIEECFHLPGAGSWREWNNTGVHHHFAVGDAPVSVPEQYAPTVEGDGWKMYAPGSPDELSVAAHSQPDRGLLALFPSSGTDPENLLAALKEANPERRLRAGRFQWPDGTSISFDVHAPAGTWVIEAVDGEPVDREYDHWPLLDVDRSVGPEHGLDQ